MLTSLEPRENDSIAAVPGTVPVEAPGEPQVSEPQVSEPGVLAGTGVNVAAGPSLVTPTYFANSGVKPEQPAPQPPRAVRLVQMDRRVIGALVLIAIGLLLLIANLSQSTLVGMLVLPALGALFLAWGVLTRAVGPLIPGSILLGLGLGVLVQELWFTANTPATGGIVVLGLGLGFLGIIPLTQLVTGKRSHWWPLIPGTILSVVAAALLLGSAGITFLTLVGQFWPVILIAIGVYLLWRSFTRRSVMP